MTGSVPVLLAERLSEAARDRTLIAGYVLGLFVALPLTGPAVLG